MEFGPNETQRLFDRILRSFLAEHLPIDEVRRWARLGTGFDEALWHGMTELGLAGLLIPGRWGGSGLGMFEAALAAEALGYAAAPIPFAAAAVMAPVAILASGSDAAQSEWLPRVAAGAVRMAVIVDGLAGETGAGHVERRATHLSGRLRTGLDFAGATHVLVAMRDGALAVVPTDGTGMRLATLAGVDRTRPLGEVYLDDAPADLLAASNPAAVARLLDCGRVMLAADTLGAAQCMLDRAVAYAGQREQFGRPIGSFQAVKHMCAEMVAMLEPCRALVWYAAHAQDALPEEARLLACHAKAHLAEVGREVSRLATEVHGGMGFTDELGLHLWFKRISSDRQLLGGPEVCRRDAAALQGLLPA